MCRNRHSMSKYKQFRHADFDKPKAVNVWFVEHRYKIITNDYCFKQIVLKTTVFDYEYLVYVRLCNEFDDFASKLSFNSS